MRGRLAVLAAVVVVLALPSLASAAPPANDAYAAAEVIAGPSGVVFGTSVEATTEPGERQSMPQLHSIWYAWTAPTFGTLSFDTAGTAWAWVFHGDDLAKADMLINGQQHGFVSVRPGETYRIGLDDWLPAGPTQLSWSFTELPPPPANDDWADAQRLDADAATVDVDTLGATREPCDPTLGNGKTLWFSWVAPADGELTVQAITDTRGTIAAVYTGDALCGLVQQAFSGGDPGIANVTAGQTYWIAVDTWTDAGGPTSFRYSFATVTRPENDNFASATPLGEAFRGSVSGSALHATSEPGEWTPFGSHTVWYSWTPAESGLASVDFQLSNGVVSTGSSFADLTTVAFGGGQFPVTGGTTYYIQVTSADAYTVQWLLEPDRAPANDDFAAAQELTGDSGYVEATNRLATLEPGEPDHGGTSQASVWFTWTAPADANATFYVDSSFWTIHQVYVGDDLASLVPVESTHDVEAQRLTFAAVAGTTYRIAVDGRAGGTGIFWLGWSTEPAGGGGGGTTGTPPDAQPDSFTTDEDTPLTLTAADLLANDSDADGDTLSLSRVASSAKSHGTVKLAKGGRIVFTPEANFNGTARFTYTVADSTGLESSATVTVDVLPVNDPPTVSVTAPADTVDEGSSTTLSAVAEDVDGDPITYDWSSTLGTVEPEGSSATVTVDDGPAAATVEVVVSDGAETASATYDLAVANVAPLLDAAPVTGVWGVPVTFTGSATDPSAADTAAGLTPSWSFGASPVAALTASRVYDDPGSYTATFSASDKDGGTSTIDVPVEVGQRRATMTYSGDTTAPFGFGGLAARFVDGVDAATARVDGRTVTFAAGGTSFTATTAGGGVATAQVGGALLPGSYALIARFAGDGLYLPVTTKGRLTVVNSAGKVTGDVTAASGTPISFSVSGDATSVRGSLTAGSFTGNVTALGISGSTAWFAGTGTDGGPFVASVTDEGEPGAGVDTLRLWIGGKLQSSGVVATGNVKIHK